MKSSIFRNIKSKGLGLGIVLATCLTSTAFAQGGSVSGGGDYSLDMKAWFTSNQLDATVTACAEIDPGFGFSREYLEKLVQHSFQNWADYYSRVGGKLRQTSEKEWNKCSIDGEIRAGFRIATRIKFLPRCDGSQDLTVYFGVENEDLLSRKKKYNFPFGFAELADHLEVRSHQPAWSKGFIWIAKPQSIDPRFKVPSWSNFDGAPLEMLVLHEMGHVFGNQHIDGTIMSAEIGQLLMNKTDLTKSNTRYAQFDPLYLSIDRNHYLVFVPELGFDLPFAPKAVNCDPFDDECINRNRPVYQMVYKNLTGLDLQGNSFTSRFAKPSFDLPSDPKSRQTLLALMPSQLSIDADGMEHQLAFQPVSLINNTPSGQAFQEGCSRDQQFSSNQISLFGYLKNEAIATKPIILNINSGLGRVELIDPGYSGETPFCKFYTQIGMPCVMLSLDFKQLK